MPNIENLKKRAKTLVRQHRGGHVPVAARLRAALPKYAALTDKQILRAPFALADALDAIAHELGFASWKLAQKELRKMPGEKQTHTATVPKLLAAYPQLFVADVKRAAEFYKTKLGFAVVYLYGEPPFYAMVERDGIGLNLRCAARTDLERLAEMRERESYLSANIPVNGVKTLFLAFQRAGVSFAQSLKEQPWGATDFILRDPDGNLICFASAIERPAPFAATP